MDQPAAPISARRASAAAKSLAFLACPPALGQGRDGGRRRLGVRQGRGDVQPQRPQDAIQASHAICRLFRRQRLGRVGFQGGKEGAQRHRGVEIVPQGVERVVEKSSLVLDRRAAPGRQAGPVPAQLLERAVGRMERIEREIELFARDGRRAGRSAPPSASGRASSDRRACSSCPCSCSSWSRSTSRCSLWYQCREKVVPLQHWLWAISFSW